jgi:hypothetical protein
MAILYRDPNGQSAAGDYLVARTSCPADALLAGDIDAWTGASTITWGPLPYRTWFRAAWNRDGLYVRFDAEDDHPWHTRGDRDGALWNEEVVEIFLDPAGSGHDYAEVEISPANVVCDLRIAEGWPTLRGDLGWHWAGMETRVVPRLPPDGTGPGSWTAIAWLPWSGLRSLSNEAARRLPPQAGDAWRFNVFRIKRPGGSANPEHGAIYAAWSVPDGPSFHVPAVFREFVFE